MSIKNLNNTKLGDARYTITQSFTFDASHNLRQEDFAYLNEPGSTIYHDLLKCFRNHGHTYKLDITWEGFPTDQQPMIYPFGFLKKFVKTLVAYCDHNNLNDVFKWPTTLENLANWFFKRLLIYESERIKLISVELREGENNRVKVEKI